MVRRVSNNASELRRTPVFERQRAWAGGRARFVDFTGWEMPVQFAGVTQEHTSVRTRAGLFDVSHMGELWIEGPTAVESVNRLVTSDIATLPVGKAIYTVCCNERGTILDDLIIYRTAPERVMVVCNASNRDKISAHFASHIPQGFRDASDETGLLALQGPRAVSVMRDLGANDIAALPSFNLIETKLAGIPVLAARTGYTGEDGFEMFCPIDQVASLWDLLLDAGAKHEVAPIGLGARDTLRLEARLSLYGNELDETTNPLEAGLGRVVNFNKGEFIGRAALADIKSKGLSRKLVGFAMIDRGIARHGHAIVDASGTPIGIVTSGAPGLSIGRNIGLGYVPTELSSIGSKVWITIRDKAVLAEVVATPFYKRPVQTATNQEG